jgi:uncharacterized protein (TIGR02679 family)
MSMTFDDTRLQRLLGGADLANLRRRLRARYEKGGLREEFTLTALTAFERRTLAGLLGKPTTSAGSMRMRHSELDEALARAGIASSLREALELLDGPLHDRRAAQMARENAWNATVARIEEPQLVALLSSVTGAGLVKRLAGGDPVQAASLLAQSARVIARLPGQGMSLAQLAAEVLGDSHALDTGRPVATVVLRACAVRLSTETTEASATKDPEESVRQRWARLGVTVNELALPALCLNLPVRIDKTAVPGPALPGEPMHISLRRLLRRPPDWDVDGREVFVCENPNIVAIAADRLGPLCAPLVCTDGMPAAAQQTLLAQLVACGATLRYHGDFDWAGLSIGNFVIREFGAKPWRFGALDYSSACGHEGVELRAAERVIAGWDERLTDVMLEKAAVVHEEAVVETLLVDLLQRPPVCA